MYNFYYQHGDAIVLAIPRCASESLASGRHVYFKQVRGELYAGDFTRVLAFIREPLSRVASGYRMFAPFPQDIRYAPSYEAYVDRILGGIEGDDYKLQTKVGGRVKDEPTKLTVDPHWISQARLIAEAPIAPNELYALEDLDKVIPGLPRFHQTVAKAIDTSYRQAELLAYYDADVQLRKGL